MPRIDDHPERPVSVSLNAKVVVQSRELGMDLSAPVDALPAAFHDEALAALNSLFGAS